jgi:SAM-dependent methyltransferase
MTDFYDAFADDFFAATVHVEMTTFYAKFLPTIPKNGTILDAGCGSGRDASFFQASGYEVTAFDASAEMCRRATEYARLQVSQMRFQEMNWQDAFDGIWACASLLHVARADLPDTFDRLTVALKSSGTLYVSFKYGDTDRMKDGRHFTDMNEELFSQLAGTQPRMRICEVWRTDDLRPGRSDVWFNALLQKT